MDLGYRCSLLYKAFWGEEEEKNPCSRCLFEENGEMCDECVISQRIQKKEGRKQTKEEFERELFKAYGKAIEKFTETRLRVEFKRADELFEHAKIRYYAGRTTKTAIFVRCPKCGRIGKLRRCGKTLFGNKYVIRHIRHGRYSESVCCFGVYSEHWEYLDEIYRKYKTEEDVNSDFYEYESKIDDFKKWLRDVKKLSKYSVRTIVTAVRTVLRRYGLVDESDLRDYLKDTPLRTATKNNYCRTIRYFREFLRSSLTEEVKKGKEGIECELSG